MWHEINTNEELQRFMELMCNFHDSCLKEFKYVSGAFVDKNLAMYPTNDKRILKVIIQRQFEPMSNIEVEFIGLKYLKFFPTSEKYTCEIFEATMEIKDDYIYWYDCNKLSESELDDYQGTLICASRVRWREIDIPCAEKEVYN
jgi:hypothetical protein